MKKFTNTLIRHFLPLIFCITCGSGALAQYTSANIETGGLYTAVAKDKANNIYVTRIWNSNANLYEVEMYAGGTGAPTVVISGLSHEIGDFPWGLAVTSNGNVYISVDFSSPGGGILEMVKSGSTYSPVAYQTGHYVTALAVDNNDNLYAAQYDSVSKKYSVVKYPANSAPNTAGTTIFDGLESAQGYMYPTGLAVASNGDVYVSDSFSNIPSATYAGKIYKLTAATSYTASVFASGNYPTALAVDASGNLYSSQISGTEYSLVRYNSLGTSFEVYNKLHTNSFYYPWGIAVVGADNIYAGDGDDRVNGGALLHLTASSVPSLSGLMVSTGTMTPSFNTSTTGYAVAVNNLTTSITVTPTAPGAGQTITVNGTAVTSGTASGAISLNVGANPIPVVVTAQDGLSTKTYTITVTRSAASNDNLSALKISAGTLTPAFAVGTTSYTASVANATSSITVTPTTADPNAAVKINGTAVTSGTASSPITLSVGANTINVVVTAANGVTVKTYSIVVTRVSNNANLSALAVSTGTITPAFNSTTTSYAEAVNNTVTSITVTPTEVGPGATIKVNGTAVASGSASGAITLAVGANPISVVVTAQDGVTTKTYTLTVTRAAASNDNLSSLKISAGTLAPAFAVATTSYTASVANSVTSMTVTPTTADPSATVTVNGTSVTSGTASGAISLNVGANTINVIVTAANGVTTKTYSVVVTRAASNNDNLNALAVSAGSITPVFSVSTTSYSDAVNNVTTSITVTPTAGVSTSTIKVNGTTVASGTASGAISLNVGANPISIVVTAQDGVSTKTYTLTVTRAAASNDNLTNLKLSSGTLSPAFAVGTTSYTASVANTVASITVTPTAADPNATIKVNGTAATSGTASGAIALAVGSNTINVLVTAANGVTNKTYSVVVTRASGGADQYDPISVTQPTDAPALADDGIVVHKGVSPNGDGIEDYLQIDNIAQYPDNRLTIMNRNGQLIFETKGYDNSTKVFDGHSNKTGQMQLPGTYFFALEYTVNGITKHKTGFLVLKY